ncbi:TSC22 domain family protein 2 [Marmota marmota marmota]|uniref:TSC22 domain family protein 2 n=1 Tax=Marmota marmota marmota TaxID=9994 RepID=UPI0007623A0E|nr:TSC22 domain family protein 2 [Marmota marmota marmota]
MESSGHAGSGSAGIRWDFSFLIYRLELRVSMIRIVLQYLLTELMKQGGAYNSVYHTTRIQWMEVAAIEVVLIAVTIITKDVQRATAKTPPLVRNRVDSGHGFELYLFDPRPSKPCSERVRAALPSRRPGLVGTLAELELPTKPRVPTAQARTHLSRGSRRPGEGRDRGPERRPSCGLRMGRRQCPSQTEGSKKSRGLRGRSRRLSGGEHPAAPAGPALGTREQSPAPRAARFRFQEAKARASWSQSVAGAVYAPGVTGATGGGAHGVQPAGRRSALPGLLHPLGSRAFNKLPAVNTCADRIRELPVRESTSPGQRPRSHRGRQAFQPEGPAWASCQGAGPGGAPPGPGGQVLPPTNVALAQPAVPLPPQPGPAGGASAAQHPQHFSYPQPQMPPGHLLPAQPSGQSEYLQQHVSGLQPPSPAQPSSTSAGATPSAAASFPLGAGQNAASAAAQLVSASPQPSEAVAPGPGPTQGGQAAPCQPAGVPPAAVGGVVQQGMGPAGPGQPPSVPPPQIGGSGQLSAVPGGPHTVVPGVPNVPAALPAPSVPSVSTTSVTMPNVPAPLAQSQQLSSHTPVSRSSSLLQHVGLPLAQGTHSAPTSLPQSDLSQFQTQTQPLVGQVDDTRRKSEPLPQPPLSLIAENKPVVKPPVADALANPLQLTPMNNLATSVFSIAIPVDGDEDRNPSTAFYQAFHLNTFQESKSLWDSASGGGVVAIDNKIEQAMDLVKSHLMYAVREEVEVLKEQIKELVERNSLLERENALLKSLSNNDQLSQLPAQQANPGSSSQQQAVLAQPPPPAQPPQQPNVSSA